MFRQIENLFLLGLVVFALAAAGLAWLVTQNAAPFLFVGAVALAVGWVRHASNRRP